MATQQTGPRLTIAGTCEGCAWLTPAKIGGRDSRFMRCTHPKVTKDARLFPRNGATPAWCPELPAARLALARSVVAAEAPCQVSLVRQIGCNLPCVRKGEHAEHQSACGRRWGGEDFTDHPDFDSRAFCDDGSEAP